jgi:polar amino acid transport system ATP-binding protein
MIKVERLTKDYGTVKVLRDVTVDIKRGEVISIIGPSGTGKSTFLRCLNLLEQPTSGAIWIDGVCLLDKNSDVPKIRQKMNMVFQSFNLFAHLPVLENLTLAPRKLRRVPRAVAEAKAMDLLRLVGLAEKACSFPDELSGGQKQRVAIARCLAMEPEIILFDEPTSALDPTTVGEVLPVIRRLAREGMTMAIVTHEMEFARDVSHRVLYMDEGRIYEEGTPEQIFENPRREKTREFINRIRRFIHRITSPDYDLYAMNAEIEAFCEKHILPRKARGNLLLTVEEVLQIYAPLLPQTILELSIGYSEKTQQLELTWDTTGQSTNPLDSDQLPDEFGLSIIRNLTEEIAYERIGDRNRLSMRMRKDSDMKRGAGNRGETSGISDEK